MSVPNLLQPPHIALQLALFTVSGTFGRFCMLTKRRSELPDRIRSSFSAPTRLTGTRSRRETWFSYRRSRADQSHRVWLKYDRSSRLLLALCCPTLPQRKPGVSPRSRGRQRCATLCSLLTNSPGLHPPSIFNLVMPGQESNLRPRPHWVVRNEMVSEARQHLAVTR